MDESGTLVSPIDAVVTWVDGSDPLHQKKRAATLARGPGKHEIPIAAGRNETRFKDNGELRYCLASIRKFAPWIRYIHLVTDNQKPSFLTPDLAQQYRIKHVDHLDIFESFDWAIPTFSSRTIETAMWRIPELAPRFLYLNDDFLITSKVEVNDFFAGDKVVLNGAWKRQQSYSPIHIRFNILVNFLAYKTLGRTRTMHLLAQVRSARLVGFRDKYFHSPHIPHPLRTGTFASFFESHPDVFVQNICYPFRDMNQYWPVSLANHLEIANDNAVLKGSMETSAINGECHSTRTIRSILNSVRSGELRFLCLSGLEFIEPRIREEIDSTLTTLVDL